MGNIIVKLLLDTASYDSKIVKAQGGMKRFKRNVALTESGVSKLGGTLKSLAGGLGVGAAFAGVGAAMGDAVRKSMEFEKSMSSLSSLTGFVGDDLDFLKGQAINLGATTTQTASQVADAFRLIGSQMPQLLESKEALAAVTKDAITLAEAAGMEVPEAAKALTGALNQMGAGAEYSGSYINILAAASQKGSADIQYLNKSVEKSGGMASTTGVKFNELVAAIETVAPKVTEASEAGTQLRNVLLVLDTNADKNLRPSVVGLGKALENLAAKHWDAGQMAKVFGRESVNAALALASGLDTYKELETAITGTNTATEQAKTNTDNLAGSVTALGSAWEGFVLTVNQSNGILKNCVDWLTRLVHGTRELVASRDELLQSGIGETASASLQKAYGNVAWLMDNKGMDRQSAYRNEASRVGRELNTEAIPEYKKAKAEFDKIDQYIKERQDSWTTYTLKGSNLETGNLELWKEARKKMDEARTEMDGLRQAYNALNAEASKTVASTVTTGTTATGTTATGITGTKGAGGKWQAPSAPVGSLAAYSNELKGLNREMDNATTAEARAEIQLEIDKLEELIEAAKEAAAATAAFSSASGRGGGVLEGTYLQSGEKADMPDGWNPLANPATEVFGQVAFTGDYLEGVEASSGVLDEIRERYEKMNEAKEEAFGRGGVDDMVAALGELGGALGRSGDNVAAFAGQAMGSIAGLIMQYGSLFKAASGASVAQAFAQAGPFAGFALAASVTSAILSLVSSLPSFATGGIVGGQDYSDGVIARVSSGEMILNQADQKRLLDSIRGGLGGGNVSFVLRGADLFGSISNYKDKTGKRL